MVKVKNMIQTRKKGYIKECNPINGKLIFEGEYINEEKKGIIREYDRLGNIIFE